MSESEVLQHAIEDMREAKEEADFWRQQAMEATDKWRECVIMLEDGRAYGLLDTLGLILVGVIIGAAGYAMVWA